jgi:heptosyltransferase-3
MRLLFITANRIGDAVLSTGLLSHLIEGHPGIRVTVAAGAPSAPLFGSVPGLERVIIVRKARFRSHWLGLWRKVGLTRWDIAVDLRRSAITSFLRTGETLTPPKTKEDIHRVDLLARMVDREDDPPLPRLWWNPVHDRLAEKLLNGDATPFLAIGPTANWPGKVWPADRFVAVMETLTGPDGPLPGARVAVLGGPDERFQAAPVLRAVPRERRIDLVGKIDLPTAAALLSRAALFIGNDSGLMHVAAAVGAPTLGLFGPSKDALYHPRGPKADFVRTPETMAELIGFDGYDRHTVGSLMTSLPVEDVLAKARPLLED